MQTIGIIGGLGPEATTDYYKEIINIFNDRNTAGNLSYPEIIIYSVNMSKFIGMMEKTEYVEAADYLSHCINMLGKAGADFAAISANTPHLILNEIQSKSKLPIISIVDAVRDEAVKLKLGRAGLIGTRITMRTSFYQDAFNLKGIEIVVPGSEEIDLINEKLFSELELGIFKAETQSKILGIVQEMIKRDSIDSLILGCTEFPLMFTHDHYLGIPFLNTTRIHVKKIVETCLEIT